MTSIISSIKRPLMGLVKFQSIQRAHSRSLTNNSMYTGTMFGLNQDQINLQETVDKFCKKELPPELVKQMDESSHFENMRKFWLEAGRLGLHGITVPIENGGLGLGYFEHCLVVETISRYCSAVGLSYAAHTNLCINQISLNGTEEQKAKYLPKLIDGSHIGALAMSEVGAGSDVTSMKLNAVKKGDYYLLNGNKFWITNGPVADILLVYAKTESSSVNTNSNKITAFLIEKNYPGFSVGKQINKEGMRGSPTSELIFEDVKVPEKQIIGGLNKGVYVLMSGLDYERLVLAAGPLGIMQQACDIAFRYAHERKQFGKTIGENQLIQGMMADMLTRTSASRAYLYNFARAIDKADKSQVNKDSTSLFTKDCAGVILSLSETATQISMDAIQILGGNGYTRDYEVGRLLRDAILYKIGAGTNQIRQWLIGREINKAYRRS